MKVPPIQLPNGMDRLPLPLPFSPDLLWRYPNPFLAQPPPSPLENHVKSGLPGGFYVTLPGISIDVNHIRDKPGVSNSLTDI